MIARASAPTRLQRLLPRSMPRPLQRAALPFRWLWAHRRHERTPLVLLGLLSLFSLGARLWWLNKPVNGRGQSALIFDEQYYVNAARVILGIHPTGTYVSAALGHDPNAEHPPLAKLLIALGIRIFGDNAWGWRIFPILFGTLALLAMYWLVRSAGGNKWLALGAASLFAVDNLMMVQGRIAIVEIFTITFMLIAAGLYLRERYVLAGITIGIGLCTKLFAFDLIPIFILLELGRVLIKQREDIRSRWRIAKARVVPLLKFIGVGLISYLALLYVLDLISSPIGGPGDCPTNPAGFHNPLEHTFFMLCYAGHLTAPQGPTGIASYPWQWLLNQVPINYYTVNNNVSAGGHVIATHAIVAFQGLMNPAIIFLALPGFALAVRNMFIERDTMSFLVVAWLLGTFIPFVLAAAPAGSLGNRISYLYYMVIVLPGVFMAVATLLGRRYLPVAALFGYIPILGYWFVTLYPFRTWSGS